MRYIGRQIDNGLDYLVTQSGSNLVDDACLAAWRDLVQDVVCRNDGLDT